MSPLLTVSTTSLTGCALSTTVNVSVPADEMRDTMDGARDGVSVRGADRTNKADSHDKSAKDRGDSVGRSPANTGRNEGNSARASATGKADSGDNSCKDVGDSVGHSAKDTGKTTADASATGVHDSFDNSAKDIGDSVGHSARDTGKDTFIGDTAGWDTAK